MTSHLHDVITLAHLLQVVHLVRHRASRAAVVLRVRRVVLHEHHGHRRQGCTLPSSTREPNTRANMTSRSVADHQTRATETSVRAVRQRVANARDCTV